MTAALVALGEPVEASGRLRPVSTRSTSTTLEEYVVPVDPMDELQCESCQ